MRDSPRKGFEDGDQTTAQTDAEVCKDADVLATDPVKLAKLSSDARLPGDGATDAAADFSASSKAPTEGDRCSRPTFRSSIHLFLVVH